MKTLLFALCILCFALSTIQAQTTGMVCAMAFDDRDGSGSHDPGEPPITGGIGFSLQNEYAVTLETQLLEESEYAARGFVCFGGLEAGEYRIVMTSAQYQPTTATAFDAAVLPGEAPPRFDFGARPQNPGVVADAAGLDQLDEAQLRSLGGIGLALAGGLAVAFVLLLLGLLLYLGVFRRRSRRLATSDLPAPPDAAPKAEDS